MLTTNTSVLTRRVRISGDHATLPYEAGWASEAVFFLQAEGGHPDLSVAAEVSPDGITWIRRGAPVALRGSEALAELPLTVFGNWLRLVVSGATEAAPARILIHLTLKG
ncbi:hypothetical protein GCM10009840_15580 [Pseudolysinimonas kribbensis]|uniref:Uncharacterized protein n=1 Tax=Pseudolysinimonas kribbensis TaxID=433641 RepID=A0ABQ6K2V4_9MICO|nr:hypothetical protein [Pseudolysinimonas kribbensis]GMA94096.1 hypothetical protein GCM10025881_09200 [Pseudolysinimonas kribbensis]